MVNRLPRISVAAGLLILSPLAAAKAPPPPPPAAAVPFVRLADMALAAKVVLAAEITRAVPLKGDAAAGTPAGQQRYYIEAAVRALISGDAVVPATVSYLVDRPDADGRKPKLKGEAVLLLAVPTDKAGMLRLVAPGAELARTPEAEARLRAILTAAVAPDAPPRVTGITRAFHVAGSLPGESETQIFLRTADARPISLSILRRPGEAPKWVVSLTELVDASAAPPKAESLLWYRLACGLPAKLPAAALTGQSEEDAAAARTDYAVVLSGLGPCGRSGG